jgi:hypothetical protein
MKFTLEGATNRAEGIDAAEDIWNLMDRINRRDTRMAFEVSREHADGERCPHPESVYGNLKAALRAVLLGLGVEVEELDAAWQYLMDGSSVRDVIGSFGIGD